MIYESDAPDRATVNPESISGEDDPNDTGRPATRPIGITALAIYHVLVGILSLLAGLALASALLGVNFGSESGIDLRDPSTLRVASTFVAFAILGVATGCYLLATSYGLWKMYGWARITALCFAGVSLIAYPLGTVVGAATLVYLLWFQGSAKFD
ncbi:MAG: hypothetical protein HC802_10950 [Caldilineaceae bacterium]|nr:hypothetical protein [Caldilineaceae bacterium]